MKIAAPRSTRRFWIKEARIWAADCVKLVNRGDWPTPHVSPNFSGAPPTEAGVYAMHAASDYFKAYPAAREVPKNER